MEKYSTAAYGSNLWDLGSTEANMFMADRTQAGVGCPTWLSHLLGGGGAGPASGKLEGQPAVKVCRILPQLDHQPKQRGDGGCTRRLPAQQISWLNSLLSSFVRGRKNQTTREETAGGSADAQGRGCVAITSFSLVSWGSLFGILSLLSEQWLPCWRSEMSGATSAGTCPW